MSVTSKQQPIGTYYCSQLQ